MAASPAQAVAKRLSDDMDMESMGGSSGVPLPAQPFVVPIQNQGSGPPLQRNPRRTSQSRYAGLFADLALLHAVSP